MYTCSGLVGPKAKMLKNQWFLKVFWGGQRGKNIPRVEKVDEKVVFGRKSDQKRRKTENKWASRHEMASMMHICGGLVGPKTENVEKPLVLPLLFEGSGLPRGDSENEQLSGPDRLGGGRGRVNPPPCGLVWGFGRFGGFVQGIYTPRGTRSRRIITKTEIEIEIEPPVTRRQVGGFMLLRMMRFLYIKP